MVRKSVVGEEVVTGANKINGLSQGAGETEPLKRNGYFRICPHLITACFGRVRG